MGDSLANDPTSANGTVCVVTIPLAHFSVTQTFCPGAIVPPGHGVTPSSVAVSVINAIGPPAYSLDLWMRLHLAHPMHFRRGKNDKWQIVAKQYRENERMHDVLPRRRMLRRARQ